MSNKMETKLGKVIISEELIAMLVGVTAVECHGLIGMSSRKLKDGIAELLGRDKLSRGVEVSIDGNNLTVDLHIIVAYGVKIPEVAVNVIGKVKAAIEKQTGLTAVQINIHVQGVRMIDK